MSIMVQIDVQSALGQNTINQEQIKKDNNTNPIDITSDSPEQFLTYTNPDYHFKLNYSSVLQPYEVDLSANQVVKFILPSDNFSQTPKIEISIFTSPIPSSNITLSDIKESREISMYQQIRDGEIRPVSSNISKIGGKEVYEQVSYIYSNDKTEKVNAITFMINGETYDLFYFTEPGFFNKYLKDFQQIVKTLEVIPHNDSLNSLLHDVDKYANYFAAVTQKSVNLTKDYQNKVGLWELGQISSRSMASITSDYLKNFMTQLTDFNQTKSPAVFDTTKNSMTSSFANEIKSYEFFKEYLITGNETKNQISTDFLSKSLEDEANAFKYFKDVTNPTSS